MTEAVLSITGVAKSYTGPDGSVAALENIALSVKATEFVSLRGPSGCGKSTLLLAAGGLLAPDRGTVTVDGNDLYALSAERRARTRAGTIGFVFQQFHLIPYLTVIENILAPSLALPGSGDATARAMELARGFGLEGRLRHVPSQLSTGERQRTALARALLNRPKLILADEPTGNLDGDNAEAVLSYLAEFARGGGAVLMVTHDARVAGHASRVITIEQGKIVESR